MAAVKKKSKKKTGSLKLRRFSSRDLEGIAECAKAILILQYSHETVEAQLKAHDLARKDRAALSSKKKAAKKKAGKKKTTKKVGTLVGMTTDEEQDILRAMLVMASAGLDSMLKQIILDALPTVVSRDELAREHFVGFLKKKLKRELDSDPTRVEFLASLLANGDTKQTAIDQLTNELRRGSLQSTEGISTVASAFGLTADAGIELQRLRETFEVRNQIVHELDINFDHARRNRNLRTKTSMISHCNLLLSTAEKFVAAVNRKLA